MAFQFAILPLNILNLRPVYQDSIILTFCRTDVSALCFQFTLSPGNHTVTFKIRSFFKKKSSLLHNTESFYDNLQENVSHTLFSGGAVIILLLILLNEPLFNGC